MAYLLNESISKIWSSGFKCHLDIVVLITNILSVACLEFLMFIDSLWYSSFVFSLQYLKSNEQDHNPGTYFW